MLPFFSIRRIIHIFNMAPWRFRITNAVPLCSGLQFLINRFTIRCSCSAYVKLTPRPPPHSLQYKVHFNNLSGALAFVKDTIHVHSRTCLFTYIRGVVNTVLFEFSIGQRGLGTPADMSYCANYLKFATETILLCRKSYFLTSHPVTAALFS